MTAAMKKKNGAKKPRLGKERVIVGLDLGDLKHEACVVRRRDAEVVERCKVANTPEDIEAFSRRHRGALVVMEVGTCSTPDNTWGDSPMNEVPKMPPCEMP